MDSLRARGLTYLFTIIPRSRGTGQQCNWLGFNFPSWHGITARLLAAPAKLKRSAKGDFDSCIPQEEGKIVAILSVRLTMPHHLPAFALTTARIL